MRSMTRGAILMHSHWQIAAGLIVGLVLIPPLHIEYSAWKEQRKIEAEQALPIVTANPVQIVARTSTYIDLRMSGYKHRACDMLDVQGFRVSAGAVGSDTTDAYRIDGPNQRLTRPVGPWDAGVWRLHLGEADSGWIQARHSCGGIVVPTILARVLPSETVADQ